MNNYEKRYAAGIQETRHADSETLREQFLVDKLMAPGTIYWCYTHYERFMLGSAVPLDKPLKLETIPELLKVKTFTERREVGVINIGGQGKVTVGDEEFLLDKEDALYIGQGTHSVEFASVDPHRPAKFYLNSAPAHHAYPCKKVSKADANTLHLGSQNTSNQRDIHQLLINTSVDTCQLQMGLTRLYPGSVWNTMPAHQHDRRNEVYFYFDLDEDNVVAHFMGEPTQTRHLFVRNEQAVVSPPWGIHCGAGTSNYAFIWGMAGENLDYADMDHYPPTSLI